MLRTLRVVEKGFCSNSKLRHSFALANQGDRYVLYALLKPLLFRLDAERAHDLVSALLRAAAARPALALLQGLYAYDDPILATTCAGLDVPNPVGLAAGFDKRAALIAPMAALGFGHIEVGTVTPRPQPGNDRPRMFRLPADRALINRLGFNSPGMLAVARNLRGERPKTKDQSQMPGSNPSSLVFRPSPPIVGVNIGKNRATALERAADDYVAAFVALAPLADYVAINISSPNTPGLRQLHERAALDELLAALVQLNRRMAQPRPLFLKVSPDESSAQLEQVVGSACQAGIAGIIATNTTVSRDGLTSALAAEAGGLSGQPLAARARQTVGSIFGMTAGRLPIIGVGGIASGAEAYARIRAGASLLQLYTGLIYGGPGVVYTIKRDLARLLRRDGFSSVAQAVGAGVRIGDRHPPSPISNLE
jgi:dihydroorotate dehydrogenase